MNDLHPRRARGAGRLFHLGILLAGLALPAAAAGPLRYVALVDDGRQAGEQVVTPQADGSVEVEFIFKDNGRGPELKERYTLAPDGTFRSYRVDGTSTFGAPVEESFELVDGIARWTSTSDDGRQPVPDGAQYAPLGGSPAVLSVAIQALSKRLDGKLPLIPGGTLTMRPVEVASVGRDGTHRDVQLVALTGLGLTPTFAWTTTGEAPRLFAFIAPGWVQIIEQGWESDADALEARQKAAEGKVLAEMRSRLAHPVPGTLLIRNARVFDSEHARLGGAHDILVEQGRIVSISDAGSEQAPADQVVEAGGRVLLPGLFDSHGHVGRWDGGLNLASGVTTVRDMGNDNETLLQLRKDAEAGRMIMPRIVTAGFLEGESDFSARNGFVVSDLAGAKEAIDWYAAHGYPQIKIYNSFPKDVLPETVAYAHQKGLRVSGHVPAFMRAQDVVDAGFDEIQHINQLLLNFFVTDTTDTRTLERFYLVAEKTAGLDLDSAPVRDFIDSLVEHDVVIDPTLATFEFLHQRDGEMSGVVADVADHLPPDIQRQRRAAEMDIPDDATAARYDRSFAKLVEFVGRAHAAGVPVVAGTDEIVGFTLQRELALYVQAGLTPAEALQTATWNAARYARVLDDRGSIEVGKRADLILVEGDPTVDIGAIRQVALVLQGDQAYYPSEIHEALGIRPFAAPLRLQAADR